MTTQAKARSRRVAVLTPMALLSALVALVDLLKALTTPKPDVASKMAPIGTYFWAFVAAGPARQFSG